LTSDRPAIGINIPIEYKGKAVHQVVSPFISPASKSFPSIAGKTPDYVLELGSTMMTKMSDHTGTTGAMHDMAGMNHMMNSESVMVTNGMQSKDMPMNMSMSGMQWTINGKVFPETDPLQVTVGKVVKIRFWNKDTQGMHPMDHPIHLHGTYFQVVSLNGAPPERETWKDTINVPAGQYVDVAFKMEEPGTWMLHCHILDHEDGGMMTMIEAK